MKLKSFGCSFIFGSDLPDSYDLTTGSKHTWPSIIAQQRNLDYECYAKPGIGNLQIMNSVLEQAHLNDPAIFIINWTWLDRFDYLNPINDRFTTLRPDGDQFEHRLYYRYFYNDFHSILVNASYLISTISILESQKIPFFMTAMDKALTNSLDQHWLDPRAIRMLQKKLQPYINWFDGKSFLDWSRDRGFPESKNWHPLEEAHSAAADYLIKIFDKQKINAPIQQVRV
jgi:hypothetical protein